ncbi:MAG: zf-HC2 domain-containing protein, partial [Rudaea sp.]|nr:zf-HC2 domain-containing protein [Rudaea sp.]
MGTLDEAEQRLVDEHLKACAACRGELEWERQLR